MADTAPSNVLTGLLANSSACSVRGFHVNRAIEFYNKEKIYFALAKETSWDSNNPPTPDYNDIMESPWGWKRVETRYMVIPDNNGSILYQNRRFKIVPVEEAKTQGSRWVYCMSYINYDELPFKTYHQVGVVTNLVTVEGTPEGKYALVPEDIQDPGDLEILNNRRGIAREADMREQIAIIIEF